MKHLLLLLFLSSAAYGQDTTQCYLQYRLPSGQSGIVKGWEVVIPHEYKKGEWIEGNPEYILYDGKVAKTRKHITYLTANRRKFPKGTLVWKLTEPVKIQ